MVSANATVLLEVNNLACRKGNRPLFKGLNCSVSAGEILRINGSNGVGKTSLLRMLCGLVQPELGEIKWRGVSLRQNRDTFLQESLYIGHKPALNEQLTAVENLRFLRAISGDKVTKSDCLKALNAAGLSKQAALPLKVLSQGQRRRVALAQLALAAHRPLWILDEPFVALDTNAVTNLTDQLYKHTQSSGMVVVVTHHEIPFMHKPNQIQIRDWSC